MLEAAVTLEGGPKCATRYVHVGEALAMVEGAEGHRAVRGFAKALQDVGHTVRYVKWDQIRESCVFINIEERARARPLQRAAAHVRGSRHLSGDRRSDHAGSPAAEFG